MGIIVINCVERVSTGLAGKRKERHRVCKASYYSLHLPPCFC